MAMWQASAAAKAAHQSGRNSSGQMTGWLLMTGLPEKYKSFRLRQDRFYIYRVEWFQLGCMIGHMIIPHWSGTGQALRGLHPLQAGQPMCVHTSMLLQHATTQLVDTVDFATVEPSSQQYHGCDPLQACITRHQSWPLAAALLLPASAS